MPSKPTPPAEAKGAQTPVVDPPAPPADAETEGLVLNESGTHALTEAPKTGLEWWCPLDYLPFAKEDGYTVVTPTTTEEAHRG